MQAQAIKLALQDRLKWRMRRLQGIAPIRALAQWTPVQAQATAHSVSVIYAAESQEGAAYVTEWDQWREAGVSLHMRLQRL